MEQRVITIIGGTGFVGRYIVKLLAKAGFRLRIVARHAESALALKTAGDVGQIMLMNGNINTPATLVPALQNTYAVINLSGILFEKGSQRFMELHARGPEQLAKLAQECGVQRFIHISALGVDRGSGSQYARTKALGEKAIAEAFPQATILRPGVIFGAEDNFYNMFGNMAAKLPFLPLIGGGKTRFQPVYVGDIAQAVLACLRQPGSMGKTYELVGPHIYSFKEILQSILRMTGRECCLLPIPFGIANIMGFFMEFLPYPPLTRDQVKLLHQDNIVAPDTNGFTELGISPTAAELVVPEYLIRFRKSGLSESTELPEVSFGA